MLRLHGAPVIAALLAVGSLLVVHVWRGWGYRNQRIVGAGLVSIIAVLVATGYLLCYVADDGWRAWSSLLHWLFGLAALPLFLLHYWQGRRIGRS